MSDSTPPSDSASWNSLVDSAKARAAAPECSLSEIIPPNDLICLAASS